MNDGELSIIEHKMRLVREATDLDISARAIMNYVLHEVIDELTSHHRLSFMAETAELTSKLKAAEWRLTALQSQLADAMSGKDISVTVTKSVGPDWCERDWQDGVAAATDDRNRSEWFGRGARLAQALADLDAANVQLGTLRAQLADLHGIIGNRYDSGYHAGVNDDPAPMNDDEWFARGFRAGQSECDAVGLRQDLEKLRKQLADAEAALEERRNQIAEYDQKIKELTDRNIALVDTNVSLTNANIDVANINADQVERIDELESELARLRDGQANVTVETSTQNQPAAVAILDATPSELAAVVTPHNGAEPATAAAPAPRSSGFRFSGTDDELRTRTIAAIKRLAAVNAGQAPTVNDWDLSCRTFGLPTAAGIAGRLDTTWGKLTVEAGLKPARGRR